MSELAIFRGGYLLASCRALASGSPRAGDGALGTHCLDYLAILATEAGIESGRRGILRSVERELSAEYDEIAAWLERDDPVRRLRAALRPDAAPAAASDLGDALDRLVWDRVTRGRGLMMRSALARECRTLRAGELGWMIGSAGSLREWCERVSVPCGPIRVRRSVDLQGLGQRLARIVTHRLADMSLPPEEGAASDGPAGLDELAAALVGLARQGGEGVTGRERELRAELVSLGAQGYAALSAQQYRLLAARWGLDGGRAQTLEEIGAGRGITREGARGLERTALGIVRRPDPDPLESEFLRTVLAPLVLFDLAGGAVHAPRAALDFRRLPPWLRPLVRRLFESDQRLVDDYTVGHGDLRISAFVDVEALLADGAAEAGLPLPAPAAMRFPRSRSPIESGLRAALAGRRLLDGYVVAARPTRGDRRAVALAALFEALPPTFVPQGAIVTRYRARHAEDGCSIGDLVQTLLEHPHLFVPGARCQWLSVQRLLGEYAAGGRTFPRRRRAPPPGVPEAHSGPPERLPARASGEGRCPEDGEAPDVASGTVLERLEAVLGLHGVLDTGQVQEALPEVPRGSIGFVVGLRHELAWFAPGLLARSRDLESLATKAPAAFFTNRQVTRLAQARHAGEHGALYPAWTARNEHALATWARAHPAAAPDAPSLIAACDLARWPIADAARRRWEACQGQARYALAREPDYDGARASATPALAYRVLSDLLEREATNWVRVNRLIRERSDSKGAIWPLLFLVAIGVLDPPEHWQESHAVRRARQRSVWERLTRHLASTGRLTWDSVAVQELVSDARTAFGDGPRGWVTAPALERLHALARDEAVPGAEETD